MGQVLQGLCGWMGCRNDAETTLNARPLCRLHFYEVGTKRLEDYQSLFRIADPQGAERTNVATFLSEMIGQTTRLVTGAKIMDPIEREMYLTLSRNAAEMFKRVQRSPRMPPASSRLSSRSSTSG